MRHAKSDWSQPGLSDHDRPLNARGKRAAPRMAKHLRSQGRMPEIILGSTAARVRETVALMLQEWGAAPEVCFEKSLYLASAPEIARHVQGLHDSWHTALIVGHNPGMSAFCSRLGGRDIELPTAAVVLFQREVATWAGSAHGGHWQVEAEWRPRELDGE